MERLFLAQSIPHRIFFASLGWPSMCLIFVPVLSWELKTKCIQPFSSMFSYSLATFEPLGIPQ